VFDPINPSPKSRLGGGAPLGLAWFALGSPALVEIAVAAGAEAVVIDMQHGLFDRMTLEAAVAVVPAGVPCLVRVEDQTPAAIGRALDAGAEGIIVPLVESADEARRAAAACHYPPKGVRSGGGIRPLRDFAGYRRAADDAIAFGVMVETAAGVADAEAIAAAAHVDFVFIGTGDLALSLGTTPATQAAFVRACHDVRAAAAAAGKPCGIFTMDAAAAAARAPEGFVVTVVANDISVVTDGFAGAAARFAERARRPAAPGSATAAADGAGPPGAASPAREPSAKRAPAARKGPAANKGAAKTASSAKKAASPAPGARKAASAAPGTAARSAEPTASESISAPLATSAAAASGSGRGRAKSHRPSRKTRRPSGKTGPARGRKGGDR
jgi:2-keto-3-deoxy-L-rhamnonate aldolase RhmA